MRQQLSIAFEPDLIAETAIALHLFGYWDLLGKQARTKLILQTNRLLEVYPCGTLPIGLWVQLAIWRDAKCN
jgi:hypothetical protein